jgi:hypothetical protein
VSAFEIFGMVARAAVFFGLAFGIGWAYEVGYRRGLRSCPCRDCVGTRLSKQAAQAQEEKWQMLKAKEEK